MYLNNKILICGYLIFWITAANTYCQVYGLLIDSRDNKKYKTLRIGSIEIMAENLDYTEFGTYYETESIFGGDHGRLYNYNEVLQGDGEKGKGICPPNWHVPSSSEWKYIFTKINGNMRTPNAGITILDSFTDPLNLKFSGLGDGTIKKGIVTFVGLGESGYYATSSETGFTFNGKSIKEWAIVSFYPYVDDNWKPSEKLKFTYMLRGTPIQNYISCRCVKNR